MDFASIHAWAFWLLTAIAAYVGSYASEKGKRRAAKEDGNQLLAELARTTETLKTIEAKIANELWQGQWRQDQTLKIYSQILGAISEYSIWLSDVSESRKFAGSGSSLSTMKKSPEQIAEGFFAAYAVAPLFLSETSLDQLERAKSAFFYHSSPFGDDDMRDADKNHELLRAAHRALATSARQDLTGSTSLPTKKLPAAS